MLYSLYLYYMLKCTCCLIIDLMIYLILRVHFWRELFNYYKLDGKFFLSTNFFYYSFLSLSLFSSSLLCISKLFLYTHSQSDALTYVTRLCTVTTSGIKSYARTLYSEYTVKSLPIFYEYFARHISSLHSYSQNALSIT